VAVTEGSETLRRMAVSTRTPDGGADGDRGEDDEDGTPPSITLQQRKTAEQRTPPTPDVRLYHRAVVVAQEATGARAVAALCAACCNYYASADGHHALPLRFCSALMQRWAKQSMWAPAHT